MKKASIVVSDSFYNKNRLFDLSDKVANRDNCLFPFYLLKKEFKKYGFNLATSDMHAPRESDLVIYNEMPKKLPVGEGINRSFLILFESELIRPDNWNYQNHKNFKKIFTWNDDVVDNVKYFKINFSFNLPESINKDLTRKKKLCVLIAANKSVDHPLELYSKRKEAIRWFEVHSPHDFDLYGIGWDSYRFTGPKIILALNKIKLLTKLLAPEYPSYKGRIDEKKSVLEKYRFAVCYENARDIPGYITEKIFDCFFAGCIPVYWGADNVADHIPQDCYIDRRKYSNYESLYEYLIAMSDDEYLIRINNIEKFLCSEKANLFSADHFVDTVIAQTIN